MNCETERLNHALIDLELKSCNFSCDFVFHSLTRLLSLSSSQIVWNGFYAQHRMHWIRNSAMIRSNHKSYRINRYMKSIQLFSSFIKSLFDGTIRFSDCCKLLMCYVDGDERREKKRSRYKRDFFSLYRSTSIQIETDRLLKCFSAF